MNEEYDLENISELKSFMDEILGNIEYIHTIILGYSIDVSVSFYFSASDRDAALDIPYMD